MEHIAKLKAAEANTIIDAYLRSKIVPAPYHPKELYQGFSNQCGKGNLIDNILLPEQGHRCCYCLKSLQSGGSIEHIIPECVSEEQIDYYMDLGLNGLNAQNICHTKLYMDGISIPGQYPHEVAYYNFAMACLKCNNERRGNKKIFPLFLVPDIKNEVRYNRQTGKAFWNNEPDIYDPTIEKLDLNSDQLKAIRSVWIFGHDNPTQTYSTPDTAITPQERNDLINRAFWNSFLADQNTNIDAYLGLLSKDGWRLLLKYGYFATV